MNSRLIMKPYELCMMTLSLCMSLLLFVSCADNDGPQSLPPDVSILPADDITRTTARISGTVVQKGSGIVNRQFFRYGISADEASMSKEIAAQALGDNMVSTLYADISGLTPATDYYYRLYAGNSSSLVASDMGHFVTLPNQKASLGEVSILSRGPLSVTCSFAVIDDGGTDVYETGCYLRTADGKSMRISADRNESAEHRMRIASLLPHTTYSLSAFAVNAEGETETSAVVFTTDDAIVLAEAGQLSDVLDADVLGYYAEHGGHLSIAGDMNGDDFYALRSLLAEDNTGREWDINLADASVVAGGRSYGYGRFTDNGVISYGMFGACALRSVVLPDGTVRLEQNAFVDCAHLLDITLPASISEVEPSDGCSALERITVSRANDRFCTEDGVLFNADMSSVVWFPQGKSGEYTLPTAVRSIGDYAFRGCSVSAFTIPAGITSIGYAAFQDCRHLSVMHLGENIDYISGYAFDGCPLAELYVEASIPPVCKESSFSSYDAEVYVPASSVGIYRAHKVWGKFRIKSK